ncbi:glucokinase [Candidatus Woesearchaeota archaeon]|nr:glucokinase [Candidatus Woesearchaeota archaeon]MBW3005922.1 glucokinase [Candidatus Woesearchaeota archaeon]
MSLILAGRIGGSKTKFAVFNYANGSFKRMIAEEYSTPRFKSFYTMLKNFLAVAKATPKAACFVAAGPCHDNVCKMTNLPWSIDAAKINKLFGIKKVTVLNDYEGIAFGIEVLKKSDLKQIKPGKPVKFSSKAVLGASTGLGESIIAWLGHDDFVLPSEGGHVDFAARNELEWELKKFVKRKSGRADVETVVSKKGLYRIYQFLTQTGHVKESDRVKKLFKKKDPYLVIADEALKGKDSACKKAVDMFTSFYASEAGNLALTAKANGGVFLVGSLSRLLARKLKSQVFKKSFEDKSKMAPLLRKIPVYVVMNEDVALLGAANLASKL